jgi:hypothetical protein
MRHITAGILGLAAIGLAGTAWASTPIANPWTNDGAEVNLNVQVGTIGEVWSAKGTDQARNGHPAVNLVVTNAGGFIPATGRYADTVYHFANVNYEVSVDLSGTIPNWTQLHVIIAPTNRGTYNCAQLLQANCLVGQTAVAASQIVTWRRDTAGYVLGNAIPGTPVVTMTGVYSASAVATDVDYAADAIYGLPPVNLPGNPVQIIWTIASNP